MRVEPNLNLLPVLPLHRLAVVLVSPRNTLNIGAVARAMSNFGVLDLRVANIYYKEFRSATSAVGPSAALLRSARDYPTTAEAVHDAQFVVGTSGDGRPMQQPLERLELGAVRMRAALARGERVALLFGSEKFGLSNDDMSHCHLLLRIPTRDQHPSMNLGQAAALCLYELARCNPELDPPLDPASNSAPDSMLQPSASKHEQHTLPQGFPRDWTQHVPVQAEVAERLTQLLAEALTISEYQGMGTPARMRLVRDFVRRLRLSDRDATLATGFLRQMLWKLRGPVD